LDNYVVKLYARAYRDLDGIYAYITQSLLAPGTASDMVLELENAIGGICQWHIPRIAEIYDSRQ
jgi:hypothetical protein